MLEQYRRRFEKDGPADIEACLSAYREERKGGSLSNPHGLSRRNQALRRRGRIVNHAEVCNITSEAGKDAQIILSTSQTSFLGLGEPIPTMTPRHIRLAKNVTGTEDGGGALIRTYEMQGKHRGPLDAANKAFEPRNALFGLNDFLRY